MKKTAITLMLIAFSLMHSAQVKKGMFMVGGSVGYNSSKNDNLDTTGKITRTDKFSRLDLGIRAGYFISDHFLIGILFSQISTSQIQTDFNPNKTVNKTTNTGSTIAPGLFCRYYKPIGESRFAVFGQLAASYGMGGTKGSNEFTAANGTITKTDNKTTENSVTVYLQPGVTYFLTKKIGVEAYFGNVGYTSTNTKTYNKDGKVATENNEGQFNSHLTFNLSSVFLGINFYFGGTE
jgi:hypothetical protein